MSARGQIGIEHLPELFMKGIKAARKEYHKMAGEYTRDFPEYMVTVHVARELRKKYGDGTVTMETNSDVLTRRSGRPHTGSRNKRYDIVLWHKKGTVRAAIEIKHQQGNKQSIIGDLDRVLRALDAGTYIEFGAVVYCYDPVNYANKREPSNTQREKAKKYRDDIEKQAKNHVYNTGYVIKKFKKPSSSISRGDDVWVGGCIVIGHKPGTKTNRAKK